MRQSAELSNLVAKHLQGQVPPSVVNEFNKLIVKMRKDESTIENAIDKLDESHKEEVGFNDLSGINYDPKKKVFENINTTNNLNDEILKGKLFEI